MAWIAADGEKEGSKVDGVKVDAEKVCKGLRCHSDVFCEEPDCEHCEYDNASCGYEIPSDALALIRQQQERIAKLEAANASWQKFVPYLYAHGLLNEMEGV